jgi:hypothetical protein
VLAALASICFYSEIDGVCVVEFGGANVLALVLQLPNTPDDLLKKPQQPASVAILIQRR